MIVRGIAGDDPADRCLVLQWIEIFRLAGQEAHDEAILEHAARAALAHELGEIGAEQDVEDRVGLGIVDLRATAPASTLPSGGACSVNEFDVGLRLLEHVLEGCDRRLAILEVRIDDGPALLLRRDRVRHQHRDLHVGRGAQAERVAVAVLPGDLVGQRFGGEEEHLLLAGELGDGEADMGQKCAGDQIDALAGDEVLGHAHGVTRIGTVVARNHLDLLAEQAALRVDLLDRELPTLLVRIEKGRLRLVAVHLADLDRLRRSQRGTAGGETQAHMRFGEARRLVVMTGTPLFPRTDRKVDYCRPHRSARRCLGAAFERRCRLRVQRRTHAINGHGTGCPS